MDAKFEAAQGKNNTYVLKFETDTDKHYFWMQVFFILHEGKSVSWRSCKEDQRHN